MTPRISMIPKRLPAAALAALALAWSAPAHAQRAERITFKGTLLDQENRQPIAQARVQIPARKITVYSGSDGVFELPKLPPGEYAVNINGMGYNELRLKMTFTRDDSLRILMNRDPVLLEALNVYGSRLRSRAERSTLATRSFDQERIRTFGGGSALAFLEMENGVRPQLCGETELQYQCAYVRGSPERINVWIDGLPAIAGLEDLRIIPVQDLFHVNVYNGGHIVEVITKDFARKEAHKSVLHPVTNPRGSLPGVRLQGTVQGYGP